MLRTYKPGKEKKILQYRKSINERSGWEVVFSFYSFCNCHHTEASFAIVPWASELLGIKHCAGTMLDEHIPRCRRRSVWWRDLVLIIVEVCGVGVSATNVEEDSWAECAMQDSLDAENKGIKFKFPELLSKARYLHYKEIMEFNLDESKWAKVALWFIRRNNSPVRWW